MRQSRRSGGDSSAGGLSLVSLPGCGERVYERLYTLAVSLKPEYESHPESLLKFVDSHPHFQRIGVSKAGVGLRKTFVTNMSDDSMQMESASSLWTHWFVGLITSLHKRGKHGKMGEPVMVTWNARWLDMKVEAGINVKIAESAHRLTINP